MSCILAVDADKTNYNRDYRVDSTSLKDVSDALQTFSLNLTGEL